MFNHDDEILGLMRKDGLLKPSGDFTSRVMQAVESKKELTMVFEPLISKKTWMIVFTSFILLSLICWQFFTVNSGEPTAISGALNKIADYFGNLKFSFEIKGNALLIITLSMLCMGMLLLIDFWFSNNSKRSAA
jgi:CDP-diglyceride synthetase